MARHCRIIRCRKGVWMNVWAVLSLISAIATIIMFVDWLREKSKDRESVVGIAAITSFAMFIGTGWLYLTGDAPPRPSAVVTEPKAKEGSPAEARKTRAEPEKPLRTRTAPPSPAFTGLGTLHTCESVRSTTEYVLQNTFKPGEAVWARLEVLRVSRGALRNVRVDFEILTAEQKVVDRGRMPVSTLTERSAMGDTDYRNWILWYNLYLPADVLPGTYALKATARDVVTQHQEFKEATFLVVAPL